MTDILAEVAAERATQDTRWGEQNHPDYLASLRAKYRASFTEEAKTWKATNEIRTQHRLTAWDGILLEEVFEALAEDDPAKLRAELVQVAAVAVAWIEAIDRRSR